MLSPFARLVMGLCAFGMPAGVLYSIVAHGTAGDRGWVALLFSCLSAGLIFLFVRDTRRQRRHPPKPS